MMQLIRFHFSIEVATRKGNVIKYSHDGERANGSKLKDAADIREVFEEALRIAFPTIEPDSKEDKNVPAGAGIQEASSEHSEKAQILEVPKTKKLEKVPLSQETKKEILQLAEMGLRPKEIANKLGIRDARQVVGTIIAKTPHRKPIGKEDNQSSEGPLEIPEAVEDSTAAAEAEKEVIEEVDLKPPIEEGDSSREDPGEIPGVPRGEMGGQEETGVREDVPLEVVSYSPAVVGGEIWDLARAGLGPAEIAEKLQERGILFSEDMVKRRLKKIQAGAA